MTDPHLIEAATDPLAQWVALSLIPNLGMQTIERLIAHFGTLDAVFTASERDLRAVRGIGPKLAAAIRALDVTQTHTAITAWRAEGLTILQHGDPAYPAWLHAHADAPALLFARGTLLPDDQCAVGLIGTRTPSPEARQIAQRLAAALAGAGWTVISGMAAGVDTTAHSGALDAGGRTVAVLGCGVRVIYPPENRLLARHIAANGALISETHPDAPPSSATLIARNRIISGLSRAVVVIETGTTGGSLHTVRFTRAQNIPLFALDLDAPGNRQLIAEGAIPLPTQASSKHLLAALASL